MAMKTGLFKPWLALAAAAVGAACAPGAAQPAAQDAASPTSVDAGSLTIQSPAGVARPPFHFASDDERLLDEVERGAFFFLWYGASEATGMVPDRSSTMTVSVAGVGFQLSALPIGVERGWVTREQARDRALLILRSLKGNPDNRKAGLFYHFIDGATAGQPAKAYEHAVSTVDSAILFAGILTASSYFGGPVRELGDALFRDADWTFFVASPASKFRGKKPEAHEMGFLSLAWRPDDGKAPTGSGSLVPYFWLDSGDEHRLVCFLAACAPEPAFRADPALYYKLRRQLGQTDSGLVAWFPFSGALFTSFFANCWIDYAAMGPDDPASRHAEQRARVDWWENSRRMVAMHRAKALENPRHLPGLGPDVWGLSASDAPKGYAVPGLFPRPVEMRGARPEFDYSTFPARDDWGDGTIAPYAAGSSILFDPDSALRALRRYQAVPGLWREPKPDHSGHYGFQDAFNVSANWVAPDVVAIDQGPLLLAIENARTGLVWRWFHAHPWVQEGADRLGLIRTR
jgi:hypothetical protein